MSEKPSKPGASKKSATSGSREKSATSGSSKKSTASGSSKKSTKSGARRKGSKRSKPDDRTAPSYASAGVDLDHDEGFISDIAEITRPTLRPEILSSIGGFAAGDEQVIHYVKHHARSLIFSASLPPYAVATVRKCVEILKEEPERRERLWANARRLMDGLKSLGFDLGTTCTPIVPIIVGKLEETFRFWRVLFDGGVFIVGKRLSTPNNA